jgi:hypothetical protein
MTVTQLKSKIRKKFRTMARFCRASGLDYDFVKYLLRRARLKPDDPEVISEMESMVRVIESTKNVDPTDLTEDMRKRIGDAMISQYGDVSTFCKRHKMNVWTVYKTLNGHGSRRISKTVTKLITILDIK